MADVTLAASQFLARLAAGNVKGATIAEVLTLLNVAAGADVSIGKQTIPIPAAFMRPTVSNGCAILADVELAAGQIDLSVLDFDASVDEHAQFAIAMPKSWNEGTITFKAFWTTIGAVTTGVAIGLQAISRADNEAIGTAWSGSTPIVVTDDAQGAAHEMLVTAESGALTVLGAGAGEMTYFRVFRDVSNGNDDMSQDMRLIGLQIFFTTDAGNDA